MEPSQVGSGMVDGAWGYVILVYAATWVVVLGLAIRAILASSIPRLRRHGRQ